MKEKFIELKDEFVLNFIDGDRWQWLAEGLGKTLIITFFATLLGVMLCGIIMCLASYGVLGFLSILL